MKIIDISQEVLSCNVYTGDSAPVEKRVISIDSGECYNLSEFSMCAHNGTHIDAPMEVHLKLLEEEIVLLEGIVLKDVPKGKYFLSALPLNIAGFDGAPCRSYLIQM